MAKISIKKASQGLNHFDLSSKHVCTTDFGQLQVSQIIPVVPSDKIHVNMACEAYFAPMVVPTFMNVKLLTRAFYVPMDAIFHSFENYYIDKQDSSAFKTLLHVSNNTLVSWFRTSSRNLTYEVTNLDYDTYDIQVDTHQYIFTERGRLVLKLLHSLGYGINFSNSDTTPFNLLPLLAFMRVVYDYVYPAQYVDALALTKYFNITTSEQYTDLMTALTSGDYTFLDTIVDLLTMPFKQDYFTAAWKNLNQPGSVTQSIASPSGLSPVDTGNGRKPIQSQNFADQTSFPISSSLMSLGVSQQGLNILSRLYDFVTRNNLVGTRFADQIFARFGIGSRKSDPNMSQEIGRYSQDIRVMDVTQMAQTNEGMLGELGGKSYTQGSGQLCDLDVDRFGYIICLSCLVPDTGYYQGRKLWTLDKGNRFDNFFTPEFDLQMRAIRNDELFADYMTHDDYQAGISYGGNPNGVFGFAPNYSEYKKGNDYVTGDFRIPSLRKQLDAYHLFRDIPMPSASNPLSLASPFLFCNQHEFDKIYQQIYTLRLPLGEKYGIGNYKDDKYIAVNGSILLFRENGTGAQIFGIKIDENGTLKVHQFYKYLSGGEIAPMTQTEIEGYYGSSYMVDASVTGTYAFDFELFGQHYITSELHYIEAGVLFSDGILYSCDSNLANQLVVGTYDNFLLFYSDYIDHAYVRYFFKIDAQRPMATISEEFQIQDGGDIQSVDLLGNRS